MHDGRAFDAAESYLCDDAQAVRSAWRTVSLVTAVRGLLQRGPEFERPSPAARHEAFRAAADELTRRGIDCASLVRYGMSREVAGPLLGAIFVSLIPADVLPGPTSARDPKGIDVDGWRTVLDLQAWPNNITEPSITDIVNFAESVFVSAMPQVMNWMSLASLDELAMLIPPTDSTILQARLDLSDELHRQYEWAVDHFSETFYSNWRTTSLHRAYRWLSGSETPPCPPELMQDRGIDKDRLNAEIARRATSPHTEEIRSLQSAALLEPEMVRYAKHLLEQKRYREAATVFEFGTVQMPGDGKFRNNLGFCLIPEDPAVALGHLETAANLNYASCEVNIYNQMCCHLALNKPRAALNLSDTFWASVRERPAEPAVLWKRLPGAGWELFTAIDPRRTVAEFSATIAHDEGWPEDEETWLSRVRDLGIADPQGGTMLAN
jgi:hypothetical protein